MTYSLSNNLPKIITIQRLLFKLSSHSHIDFLRHSVYAAYYTVSQKNM